MQSYFEIFFRDLNKEAQNSYLKWLNITDIKESNQDTLAIAVIPYPIEDEDIYGFDEIKN